MTDEKILVQEKEENKKRICDECDKQFEEYKDSVKTEISSLKSFALECDEEYLDFLMRQKQVLIKYANSETNAKKKTFIKGIKAEEKLIEEKISKHNGSEWVGSVMGDIEQRLGTQKNDYRKSLDAYLNKRFPYEMEKEKAFKDYKKEYPSSKVKSNSAEVLKLLPDYMDEFYEDEKMKVQPYPLKPKLDSVVKEAFEKITEEATNRKKKTKEEISEHLEVSRQKQEKRNKIKSRILGFIVFVTAMVMYIGVISPFVQYSKATSAFNRGEFELAASLYSELDYYIDSHEMYYKSIYQQGVTLYNNGEWDAAIATFERYDDRYEDDYNSVVEYKYLAKAGKAKEFFAQENWYNAIEMFDEIDCYSSVYGTEEKEMHMKAVYNYAGEQAANGNIVEAINLYESLSEYKDCTKTIRSLKYKYVKANQKNKDDYKVHAYLLDLKNSKYKDAEKIYKKLYGWHMEVYFNTSRYDTTSCKSISKYDPVYCHYKVTGGPPSGQIYLEVEYTLPSGETDKDRLGNYENNESGTFYWRDGIYQNPEYGETGTLKLVFKGGSNVIGTYTVKIK